MLIGEVARRSGMTPKTLRFYEAAGLLPQVQRKSNGYRDYDDQSLDRLRLIRCAQTTGLSLSEIGWLLAATHGEDRSSGPVGEHALVEDLIVRLDRQLEQLRAFRRELISLRSQPDG